MYVCICNAIREDELRQAALCTGDDAESIYQRLGKAPNCRQCLEEAEDIISEVREPAEDARFAA